jgi:DNA-binding NarL/FixJ family response regulator
MPDMHVIMLTVDKDTKTTFRALKPGAGDA